MVLEQNPFLAIIYDPAKYRYLQQNHINGEDQPYFYSRSSGLLLTLLEGHVVALALLVI